MMKFPLIAAGVAAIAYGAVFTLRAVKRSSAETAPRGAAFNLKVTLILAATLTAALLISAAINHKMGRTGVMLAAAIAGLADAHSAAVSVASLVTSGKMNARDAVVPIFAALSSNTIIKAVLAFTSGGRAFAARVVPGLILMIAALWIVMLV